MLYREIIIVVCSEIHTKHINIWAERRIVNVKRGLPYAKGMCDSLLAVLRSITDIKAFFFTSPSPQLLNYKLKTKLIFFIISRNAKFGLQVNSHIPQGTGIQ
jgi:hypothetical protein